MLFINKCCYFLVTYSLRVSSFIWKKKQTYKVTIGDWNAKGNAENNKQHAKSLYPCQSLTSKWAKVHQNARALSPGDSNRTLHPKRNVEVEIVFSGTELKAASEYYRQTHHITATSCHAGEVAASLKSQRSFSIKSMIQQLPGERERLNYASF